MLLHAVSRLLYASHALTQLPLDAAPFLFTHLIETVQKLSHLCQDRGFERTIGGKGSSFQRARHAKNCIQIEYRCQTELGRRGSECLDVASHYLPIEAMLSPPPRSRLRVNSM